MAFKGFVDFECVKILEEIGRKDVLLLHVSRPGKLEIKRNIDQPNLSKNVINCITIMGQRIFLEKFEVWLSAQVYGKGPKVFRPSSSHLRLLHEMTLNISFNDYVQPFETVVIELPDDYCETWILEEPISKTFEKPLYCTLHWQTRPFPLIAASLTFSSKYVMKSWWSPEPDDTLEDWLEDREQLPGSLEVSSDELRLFKELKRSILNYCLLLDEVGIRKIDNPRRNKLEAFFLKGGKHQETNRLMFKTEPRYYSLNQEVTLVKRVASLPGESTGTTKSPHHRRGYYRMQPYGEGNKLRKRI